MLNTLIKHARKEGASDVHIEADTPVVFRVRGDLVPSGYTVAGQVLVSGVKELLGPNMWVDFLSRGSADLSRTIEGIRCRINVYHTVRGISLAIRLLYSFNNTIRECNLNSSLKRLTNAHSGLVIISGPTGSGKSTTLAALIEEINSTSQNHIITLESPIEYFFTSKKSVIRQREVHSHTPSYEQAITDALREDPDVLVIGEMRTQDVMRLTLNAAETGHLVIATMHSSTCGDAVRRMCMSFPSDIQDGIRAQISDCLVGVVCQRLVYLPQYDVRAPHCEVLTANTNVRATIRNGQFSQLVSAIQTGGEDGMWTFDRYKAWMDEKTDWYRREDRNMNEASNNPENLLSEARDDVMAEGRTKVLQAERKRRHSKPSGSSE